MTKMIIATMPDDAHAISVKIALSKNKHIADLWYTADFPSKSAYSFNIKKNKVSWLSNEKTSLIHDNDYDIVWYRRPRKPVMPDYIHPDDLSHAKKEADLFIQSIWHTIFPNANWINSVGSSQKATSKLLQLKLADEAELKIPETLISNDPQAIKHFIKTNTCVYKTLYPAAWIKNNEVHLMYTKDIKIEDLPSDKLLQCTPGIFQEKIEKKFELRVTYFGSNYIAVKIDSQKFNKTKTDWRRASYDKLLLEQVTLPKKIDLACKQVMNKLGIVFGCFDLIVTPQNEYYFLEVNEQGQFLWIEANNPDIKMLKAFIDFVTNQNIDISLCDIKDETNRFAQIAVKNHINPPCL